MPDINDQFDKLLIDLSNKIDDAADDVDQAAQYSEWFIRHALTIEGFGAQPGLSHENMDIIRHLWARYGRALYTLTLYKAAQPTCDKKDKKEEPKPIDIYNTIDDIHNRTSMGYYIMRNRNRIRKILR